MRNISTSSKLTALFVLTLSVGAAQMAYAETTGQYIDDSAVTAKVKTALLADAQLKAMGIKVETTHGIVQLSGTVDTKTEESKAIKIANGIDGVKSVNDTITVKGTQQE
jgi:hyperosmotically inducible protein